MKNVTYTVSDGIQISYPFVGCAIMIALMLVWAMV